MKDMRPAFARPSSQWPNGGKVLHDQEGMTYREWAAAQVMAALMVGGDDKGLAKLAVRATDALIAELDKDTAEEGRDA